MCGLFGWYIKNSVIPEKNLAIVAAILASENETRGPDSFGFATSDGKTVHIDKMVGRVSSKCNISKYIQIPILIGHTRRATSGAINQDNAHPWLIKGIVGAHNGWVTNKSELDNKYPDRKCDVDSQHIFHQIGDQLDLGELKVHGAITYLMTRELNKVYLLRSQTGDLAIHGIGRDRKKPLGIVWSSEESVVSQALDMAGIEHWNYEVKPKRMYTIENNTLYRMQGEVPFDPQYANGNYGGNHRGKYSRKDDDWSDVNWHEGWIWNAEKRKYEPPLDNDDKKDTKKVVIKEWRDGKLIDVDKKPKQILIRDVRRFGGEERYNNKGEGPQDTLIEKVVNQITNNQQANQLMLSTREKVEHVTCEGCREMGPIVLNHAFIGIRFYFQINQWLCNECAKLWGQNTGQHTQ